MTAERDGCRAGDQCSDQRFLHSGLRRPRQHLHRAVAFGPSDPKAVPHVGAARYSFSGRWFHSSRWAGWRPALKKQATYKEH